MKNQFCHSAVVIKFKSKRGAKKFATLLAKMILGNDLPTAAMNLLKKDFVESEII